MVRGMFYLDALKWFLKWFVVRIVCVNRYNLFVMKKQNDTCSVDDLSFDLHDSLYYLHCCFMF